ncbi:hypothetical protein ACFVY0_40190 [Streptomyces sp. NPDC058286]|uniref:hypothetical protein n=1 Tax=Streptomyces sp. NPDC058286 TaxID=3346422 RepID=UPI0036DFD985
MSCDNAAQLSSWNAGQPSSVPARRDGVRPQDTASKGHHADQSQRRRDTLHLTLHHNVDVNTRAAAAVEIEALVHAHRPRRVTVQVLAAGEPTPATLSVVVRAHRMCQSLDIPLSLTGACPASR